MSAAAATGRVVRRVLVAVDAATHDLPCIDCVVELASRLRAEVTALFVEDDELLRIAALPPVCQVSFLTAAEEALDVASTERALRAMAAAARQRLASEAERRMVKWTFRAVRGRLEAEVSSAARDADVVAVRGSARPLRPFAGLRAPLRAIAERTAASVLLLPSSARIGGAVVALHDGSRGADAALTLAVALAAGDDQRELIVVLIAPTGAGALQLEAAIRARLSGATSRVRFLSTAGRAEELRAALRNVSGGLIVLGRDQLPADLGTLAEELDLTILTVRPRSR